MSSLTISDTVITINSSFEALTISERRCQDIKVQLLLKSMNAGRFVLKKCLPLHHNAWKVGGPEKEMEYIIVKESENTTDD